MGTRYRVRRKLRQCGNMTMYLIFTSAHHILDGMFYYSFHTYEGGGMAQMILKPPL